MNNDVLSDICQILSYNSVKTLFHLAPDNTFFILVDTYEGERYVFR